MDYKTTHKAHPWHGISLGDNVPDVVRAFVVFNLIKNLLKILTN